MIKLYNEWLKVHHAISDKLITFLMILIVLKFKANEIYIMGFYEDYKIYKYSDVEWSLYTLYEALDIVLFKIPK